MTGVEVFVRVPQEERAGGAGKEEKLKRSEQFDFKAIEFLNHRVVKVRKDL